MKTLLITYGTVALILFIIGTYGILHSCSYSNYKDVEYKKTEVDYEKTEVDYEKTEVKYKKTDDGRNVEVVDSDVFYNMRYIEFDGHEYVYYRSRRKGSMCHSPKCECLNEYKK